MDDPETGNRPDRTPEQEQKDARIAFLRSRAAVARAEVDAVAALHADPDTLEEMLLGASPSRALEIEEAERAISARVVEAREIAEAAEADYEQAMFEAEFGPDA